MLRQVSLCLHAVATAPAEPLKYCSARPYWQMVGFSHFLAIPAWESTIPS